MQFLILLIGALLFSFYTIYKAPLFFNESAEKKVAAMYPDQYVPLAIENKIAANHSQQTALALLSLKKSGTADAIKEQSLIKDLNATQAHIETQRKEISSIIKKNSVAIAEPDSDSNYIFLHFVRHYLPAGMVGLLFAIIFLASWGSISAAINALASSTLIDFHQVFNNKTLNEKEQLKYGRLYTLCWGLFSIAVAMFATKMGSLIEAVNELGSLFYGSILGIFLTAFFLKKVKGTAVFYAAILSEAIVLMVYISNTVAFLWLNVIGAVAVMLLSLIWQSIINQNPKYYND